jgi:hypothetical protein
VPLFCSLKFHLKNKWANCCKNSLILIAIKHQSVAFPRISANYTKSLLTKRCTNTLFVGCTQWQVQRLAIMEVSSSNPKIIYTQDYLSCALLCALLYALLYVSREIYVKLA